MKRGGWKRLWPALIVAALVFIWGNSLLPATVSETLSDGVVKLLSRLGIGGGTFVSDEAGVVRKLAHMLEFALLGLALVDETLQLWSDGRAGAVADVWIDMGGFCLGASVVWARQRRRRDDPA